MSDFKAKCTKFNFRSGSAQDPAGVAYNTRVLCDETKQCTADILIPHERAITLVL